MNWWDFFAVIGVCVTTILVLIVIALGIEFSLDVLDFRKNRR